VKKIIIIVLTAYYSVLAVDFEKMEKVPKKLKQTRISAEDLKLLKKEKKEIDNNFYKSENHIQNFGIIHEGNITKTKIKNEMDLETSKIITDH